MKKSIFLLLVFILSSCASTPKINRELASTTGETWVLSGYLPEKPKNKVYLTISGEKIIQVSDKAPFGLSLLDTDSTIFAGFIDMHSHIKYNVLGLWDLANSQFLNRFEWRSQFPPYKDAISANMKQIRGDAICAAVRWAEIKALTGGATSMQGIGGDFKCAADFGVNNIEIPADFGGNSIRSITDMLKPDLIGKVFEPMIAPLMKNERLTYEQAYKRLLKEQKVDDWVQSFVNEDHNLGNGLKLLIGTDLGAGNGSSPSEFQSLIPQLRTFLSAPPYSLKEPQITKQINAMNVWLFGKDGKESYVRAKKEEMAALALLSKDGVLTINSALRDYIYQFEIGVRQFALTSFKDKKVKAIIAHIAEGMNKDKYNMFEYKYLKQFELNKKGLVMVHAVGLTHEDLRDAARNDISIVWSPFSNLLLYGETLDVKTARDAGLNVALGADWSPTGSKHILDEIKIARRYLDKTGHKRDISNKDLVNMVTVNAAKALHLEDQLGKVAPRFTADLTLLDCKGTDPYDCVIEADQSQVSLVVVKGQGIYGEPSYIETLASVMHDQEKPETFPKNSKECTFKKSLRQPWQDKFAQFRTPTELEKYLQPKLKTLDPIFNCEDAKYNKRFADFIEKELDQNIRARNSLRNTQKLKNDWTPLNLTEGGEEKVEDNLRQ